MKKNFFFLTALYLLSWSLHAQNTFPDQCSGIWRGMMYISKNGMVKDSVKVRLSIAPLKNVAPPAWSWKTEYLSDKMPMTKDYVLRLKDAAKNWYVTDEGAGVELQDYLFANKFYCVFETNGVMLTSTYELKGEELIFEVTAGKKIAAEQSEIVNYSVDNLQRVVFRREK